MNETKQSITSKQGLE